MIWMDRLKRKRKRKKIKITSGHRKKTAMSIN
jgi:hypothetical protein